ncbi:unnamed protein product [Mortierella alpina]
MFSKEVALDKTPYDLDSELPHFSDEIQPLSFIPNSPRESLAECVRQHIVPIQANEIYGSLWMAGLSCVKTRTLTQYHCLGNTFVVTDDVNLHLVWDPRTARMFIKPLPSWCTNYDIVSAIQDHDPALYHNIHGFLFSFSKLVRSQYDFKLAQEHSLIGGETEWEAWRTFMNGIQFIECTTMPGRYWFGPLRLNRLNLIKRISFRNYKNYKPFYFSTYTGYTSYFQGHFQASVLVFAFMSILLSSGQLIISIEGRPVWRRVVHFHGDEAAEKKVVAGRVE